MPFSCVLARKAFLVQQLTSQVDRPPIYGSIQMLSFPKLLMNEPSNSKVLRRIEKMLSFLIGIKIPIQPSEARIFSFFIVNFAKQNSNRTQNRFGF